MLNEHEIWFKLHKGLGRSGLIADLGIECTVTLIALAHWIDENGQCFSTQEQVAEMIGVTRKTAQRYLARLIAYRNPDGKPIVTKVTKRTLKGHRKDFYTFHPEASFHGDRIKPCHR